MLRDLSVGEFDKFGYKTIKEKRVEDKIFHENYTRGREMARKKKSSPCEGLKLYIIRLTVAATCFRYQLYSIIFNRYPILL